MVGRETAGSISRGSEAQLPSDDSNGAIWGLTALVSTVLVTVLGAYAGLAALDTLVTPVANPWLCPGAFHDEVQGWSKLREFGRLYNDRMGWENRARTIRKGILGGAGLDPLPPRTPLRPLLRGERPHDGYSVENVAFESTPGFFVTGNLYRPWPRWWRERHPAILLPHGHSPGQGRFDETRQKLGAMLARAGAVVLAWDMVGFGESVQHEHPTDVTPRLQLWNSIRAVDFLQSLAEVDPARIGVTGESGGGTHIASTEQKDKSRACTWRTRGMTMGPRSERAPTRFSAGISVSNWDA